MKKERLFLKGEGISNLTEYDFSSMISSRIESGIPAYIPISIVKDTEQTASDLENLIASKIVGIRRVLQDVAATKTKVVIEVELNSDDYIKLMKALGNGYLLTGYSIELWMKVSNLGPNDTHYIEYTQSADCRQLDDEEGYPQLDIEQENDIFTAYLRVCIPISLLIKLGAKTFKELYNKVTDDCELDVDFNVETKSADPEPISTQSKDSESEYKSILYPEVKFENLKDAKKYADAINKGIGDTLKSSNEISNLPMLTIDDFKDFKAYIEKATIGTSHHEGFKDNIVYSVVLCIYVPNEVIEKLKEDNVSLEDIIQYALENIEVCRKGKLKKINISTYINPIGIERRFNSINEYLKNSQSVWRKKDGNVTKTYRVVYTYVKNAKIKALAIEKE